MISRRSLLITLAATVGLVMTGGGRFFFKKKDAPAFSPWKKPTDTSDFRARLTGWASLAPSFRNLQPWTVWRDGADGLALLADPHRLSPVVDPLYHQTFLSQGTFLELLELAATAEGMRTETELFPDGPVETPDDMRKRPVAYIRCTPDDTLHPPSLFSFARMRSTTKIPFTGQALSDAIRDQLLEASHMIPGVGIGWVDRGPALERVRSLAVEGISIAARDPQVQRELSSWLRLTPSEVLSHRDGLIPLSSAVGSAIRVLYGDQAFADPDSFLTQFGSSRVIRGIETSNVFTWLVTATDTRADQIIAGRAYMRLDLQAAGLGVAVQPISQPLTDHPSMATLRAEMHRLLALEGHTIQMLVRLGYAKPRHHTPRRPVSEILHG